MDLMLQVEPQLAAALNVSDHTSADAHNLIAVLQQAQATLEPLDPDQSDADLSRYFQVKVPEAAMISLRDSLLQTRGVSAAYVKPDTESP
jgi:hypothetical protein